MRVDELQRVLASARDEQLAADVLTGRRGVDRHVRRQRAERAGFAALIVVLLAGAGVFLATRGTDEQRVISGPDAVPHYLPDPMPAGTPLLREYPINESTTGTTIDHVVSRHDVAWTNDPGAQPTTNSPILLLSVTTWSNVDLVPSQGETQVVDDGFLASWVDEQGRTWLLSGHHVASDDFASARATARLTEKGAPTVTPPTDYREVARSNTESHAFVEDYSEAVGYLLGVVDPTAPGYIVAFDSSDDRVRPAIGASARPASEVWLLAARVEGLETVEVRGRSGYLVPLKYASQSASSEGGPREVQTVDVGAIFFWWETDSLLLASLAPTAEQAEQLAHSLREVGDEAWTEFTSTATPLPNGVPFTSVGSSSGTAIASVSTLVPTTVP
jgi:hypothetical protein